ncbi:MAG: AraC family transcriptional regulator [Eubacteriales bacterium]|nr:AraC family transcriptional regulator [Eubacteriales bacterium]
MPINRTKYHFGRQYLTRPLEAGDYKLVQIGDLNCEPGYRVSTHKQWVAEISMIISGSAIFEINDQKFTVDKGQLCINGCHETHAIQSSYTDPMRMLYLAFSFPQDAPEPLASLRAFYEQPPVRVVSGTLAIQEAYVRLLTEIMEPDILSTPMIESCMHEIVGGVYRLCVRRSKHYYQLQNDCGENKLAYEVMHYLDAQDTFTMSLSRLSDEFGYSYAYIAQKFMELTGERLKDYYTRKRFEQAQRLIHCGLSITETAEKVGYKSIHTFSKAFRKYAGVTARDYARSVRDPSSPSPLGNVPDDNGMAKGGEA